MITKPDVNPDHDPHAAGLYCAMALRFHARYLEMRRCAAFRGGDFSDHVPLCTPLEASDRYKATVEAWLWEEPDTPDAVLALVDLAAVIAIDKLTEEALRGGGVVADETDAFHQLVALSAAGRWLNEGSMKDWLDRRRAAYGPGGMAPGEQ